MRLFLLLASFSTGFILSFPSSEVWAEIKPDPQDFEFQWSNNTELLDSVPITRVLAPQGYDDNDMVQVIFLGHFENECYRFERPHWHSKPGNPRAFVAKAIVRHYISDQCAKTKSVDWLQPVDMMILQEGDYEIWLDEKIDGPAAKFSIKKAADHSPRDEESYARVTSLGVEEDEFKIRQNLALYIQYANDCEFLDLKKTKAFASGSGLIEVLPVVGVRSKPGGCKNGKVFAKEIIRLQDPSIQPGRFVFHVRTNQGLSINAEDAVRMNGNPFISITP